tara:strand:- start:80 stop:571 length:492 start_codon:yes stop_codon:yes gene_type:complete
MKLKTKTKRKDTPQEEAIRCVKQACTYRDLERWPAALWKTRSVWLNAIRKFPSFHERIVRLFFRRACPAGPGAHIKRSEPTPAVWGIVGAGPMKQQAMMKRDTAGLHRDGDLLAAVESGVGYAHVLPIADHPDLAVLKRSLLVASRNDPHTAVLQSDIINRGP